VGLCVSLSHSVNSFLTGLFLLPMSFFRHFKVLGFQRMVFCHGVGGVLRELDDCIGGSLPGGNKFLQTGLIAWLSATGKAARPA